jgi:type I restriction enzyme S subunit
MTDATEWSMKPLGAVATLQRGFDLPTRRRMKGTVPIVSSAGVSGSHDKAMVAAPGVVTGRYGTIGQVFYLSQDFWPLNTTLWASSFHGNDPLFVYYLLQRVDFATHSSKSGVPGVNRNDLHAEQVYVPLSRAEQHGIAVALRDADALIATLDRLIAKKQAIRQGMMQRLISTRAHSADVVPLGTVTSWLSGGTPNRSNLSYWSGSIPWISATTLKRMEVTSSDQMVTPAAVRAGSKMAPLDSTLVLVRGSALHSEIRASLVTGPVCFNQDVKALVPARRFVPRFLTYSIHGNADRLLRLVTSAGNTAGVLDTAVLKAFQIWLPDRSEQDHVVTALDDITSEIDKIHARLSKAKAVKQGMMQELLTGRTRLPVVEAVT